MGRREFSPESSHRPLAVASCRHRAVYEQKKFRTCRRLRRNYAGAAAVVRSNTLTILPFPYGSGIPRLGLEPATSAASTDRNPSDPGQHGRAPGSPSATVRNGTEDRPVDDTLSPKVTTVAYATQTWTGYRGGTAIRTSDAIHDAEPARPPPLRTPATHQPARP